MISIIIPIYNVEKYLRQCLDSVANQTCARMVLRLEIELAGIFGADAVFGIA